MIAKPQEGQYNPFYKTYIGLVPDGDPVAQLERQIDEAARFFRELPADKHGYRYAPGKWTPIDVLGHILDNERIMSYRLLCVAYGEQQELPGYDEKLYMGNDPFADCSVEQVLDEYMLVRKSTLAMLKRLPEQLFTRVGTVNGGPATAAAIAYVIAGHELHHLRILRERYL